MAASPRFKVYTSTNDYEAACKHPETAAAIIAGIGGNGWTIRDGHSFKTVVWAEGAETMPAGESYDNVAALVYTRIKTW